MAAVEAIGGVPNEILYDSMKTAVIGEAGGRVVYNRSLVDFARHYCFQPKACACHYAGIVNVTFAEEKPHCRSCPSARC